MKIEYEVTSTLLRRMRSVGCPMPEEDEIEPLPGLTVEVSQPQLTRARDQRRNAEFVFGVRISNNSYNDLAMTKIMCTLPWKARLAWLVDPRLCRTGKGPYRFSSGLEFGRKTVLNHRVGPSCVIKSGAKLDGIFLGVATDTIPRYFSCGLKMPVRLLIVDQFGTKHRSGVDILVDRTATALPLQPRPRRSTLYDPVGYEVFNANRPLPRANRVVPNSPAGPAVGLNDEKDWESQRTVS